MSSDKKLKMDEIEQAIAELAFEYLLSIEEPQVAPFWQRVGDYFMSIQRAHYQSARDDKEQEILKRLKPQGWVSSEEAIKRSGLNEHELSRAKRARLIKAREEELFIWQGSAIKSWLLLYWAEDLEDPERIRQGLKKNTLITTQEAAMRMRVSAATFRKWAERSGVNPAKAYKAARGEGYLYSLADVDKVIEYRERKNSKS